VSQGGEGEEVKKRGGGKAIQNSKHKLFHATYSCAGGGNVPWVLLLHTKSQKERKSLRFQINKGGGIKSENEVTHKDICGEGEKQMV